jgi:hypothetical protein
MPRLPREDTPLAAPPVLRHDPRRAGAPFVVSCLAHLNRRRGLSARWRQGRRPDPQPRLVRLAAGPAGGLAASAQDRVDLLLQSRFPMFVAWGEELGFLYNDPYAEILGAKHPRALGSRFHDIWAEIWPTSAPRSTPRWPATRSIARTCRSS